MVDCMEDLVHYLFISRVGLGCMIVQVILVSPILFVRLQKELGLSPDLLTRGRRKRTVMVPKKSSGQSIFQEKEEEYRR